MWIQARYRLLVALSCTVGAGRVAVAQAVAHPNFTGVWVLDAVRSDTSSFTPKAATYTVVQHGDTLTYDRVNISSSNDTAKSRMVWGIDGMPWKNVLPLVGTDVTATSVLTWEKDVLVIHTSSQPTGVELQQVDRWSLSADGKTLFMHRQATFDGQNMGSPTLIFVKKG